jgi:flagellar export protein FliJ
MTQDPLKALLRLRRRAVDEARSALADCLRNEDYALHEVATIKAAIEREMQAAASLAAGDAEVEAFAAWLRRMRPRQHAAHMAEDQAEAATARARIVLGAARAAVQAAEEMLAEHEAARLEAAQHHEQQEIDETALRISTRPASGSSGG